MLNMTQGVQLKTEARHKKKQRPYIFSYNSLIPCPAVLDKLTLLLVKKSTAFYKTRRLIFHKRPPPVPILRDTNPVYALLTDFFKIHSNTVIPSTPRSSPGCLLYTFHHQYPICNSSTRRKYHMPYPFHSF